MENSKPAQKLASFLLKPSKLEKIAPRGVIKEKTMIIIDGTQSSLSISNYTNLEEALIHIANQEEMKERIVTDVIINDQPFSEIYPHQAEDIFTGSISSLELKTISAEQMSGDILEELPKVVTILVMGSNKIAELLRSGATTEGLELMQDTIDVSRDFLAIIGLLITSSKSVEIRQQLQDFTKTFSDLISEAIETMGDEDWILTADLFEYELVPTIKTLDNIVSELNNETSQGNVQ